MRGIWGLLLLIILAGSRLPASDLIEISAIDASIRIQLRYAGQDNIAGQPLYPVGFVAKIERSTGARLLAAQQFLKKRGLGLMIWDAMRPVAVQKKLWELHPDPDFVANPEIAGGSLHTWGVAVDATLVDLATGAEKKMPTDFDAFGPEAALRYAGTDTEIRRNLRILQEAMAHAGFQGCPTEWWHFVDEDWQKLRPPSGLDEVFNPAAKTSTRTMRAPER